MFLSSRVDDAGAAWSADPGRGRRVSEHRRRQRPRRVAAPDARPCRRLVDHEHGGRPRRRWERDRLGDEVSGGSGGISTSTVSRAPPGASLARAAVDAHVAVVDERLHARA